METHGSETYFVIGEGLLGEAVGGRNGAVPEARARGAVAATAVPPFRFSRLGPKGVGKQLADPLRKKVGNAMAVGGGGAGPIPSGFTYLGQFIDHDLTFDKTTVMFGANVSPTQMLEGRSPTLDLDSLYGAGPADPESAKFYAADGVHLKTGKALAGGGVPTPAGSDLPRGAGSSAREADLQLSHGVHASRRDGRAGMRRNASAPGWTPRIIPSRGIWYRR